MEDFATKELVESRLIRWCMQISVIEILVAVPILIEILKGIAILIEILEVIAIIIAILELIAVNISILELIAIFIAILELIKKWGSRDVGSGPPKLSRF